MSKKLISKIGAGTGTIDTTIGKDAIVGLFNVRNTNTKTVTTIQRGSTVRYDDFSDAEMAELRTQDFQSAIMRIGVTYALLMILILIAIIALIYMIRSTANKNKKLKEEIEELEMGQPLTLARGFGRDRRNNEEIIYGYSQEASDE